MFKILKHSNSDIKNLKILGQIERGFYEKGSKNKYLGLLSTMKELSLNIL